MKPLLPIFLFAASVSAAHATVIIGNLAAFNSNDTSATTGINYNPGSVGPPLVASGYGSKALGFTMTGTFSVTSLSLRLSSVSGGTDDPLISIWTGTTAPVSQVGTFTNPAAFLGAASTTYTFTPSGTITLSAGTSYFIVVQQLNTTGPDYGFIWDNGGTTTSNTNTVPTGTGATNGSSVFGGGPAATSINQASGRFNWYQLEGTLVPEPSSSLLLGAGFATALLRRSRRASA